MKKSNENKKEHVHSKITLTGEHQIILGYQRDNIGVLSLREFEPRDTDVIHNFRHLTPTWYLTARKVSISSPLEKYDKIHSALTPKFWKEWGDLMMLLNQSQLLDEISNGNLPLIEIPLNLQSITQISKISLGRLGCRGWPSGLENMTQLKELIFYSLEEIPQEIGLLKDLIILNLRENSIFLGKIAPEIGQLSNLEQLIIRTTTSLPPEIGQLSRLKKLTVYAPEPISFPIDVGSLDSLEFLGLHGSCPVEFPAGFCNLKTLKNLYIERSPLLTFPDEIRNLRTLESVDIIETELIFLPESFCTLANLKYLYLERNTSLEYLPQNLGNLPLEYLSLIGNRIFVFPKSLADLPCPTRLKIYKGIYIDEGYVRSLYGLPVDLIVEFFFPNIHNRNNLFPEASHLSLDFLSMIDEEGKNWDRIQAYYAKSVLKLAEQASLDSSSLTEHEWSRLAHEGTYSGREILDLCLPLDHPGLLQISARLTLKSPNLHSDDDFHLLL